MSIHITFEHAIDVLAGSTLALPELTELIPRLGANHPTHFGDMDVGGLELQQIPAELAAFASYLVDNAPSGRLRYLEVGVGSCGTMIFLKNVLERHNIRLDLFGADSLLYEALEHIDDQRSKIRWVEENLGAEFYIGDTGEGGFSDFLKGKKFDLILIDAEHTYDAVIGEFLLCLPHLARDGMMAFHDVASVSCPQVVAAYHKIRDKFSEHIEFVHSDKCGIGLCRHLLRPLDTEEIFDLAFRDRPSGDAPEMPALHARLLEARAEIEALHTSADAAQMESSKALASARDDALEARGTVEAEMSRNVRLEEAISTVVDELHTVRMELSAVVAAKTFELDAAKIEVRSLSEALSDYMAREEDMTAALGKKAAELSATEAVVQTLTEELSNRMAREESLNAGLFQKATQLDSIREIVQSAVSEHFPDFGEVKAQRSLPSQEAPVPCDVDAMVSDLLAEFVAESVLSQNRMSEITAEIAEARADMHRLRLEIVGREAAIARLDAELTHGRAQVAARDSRLSHLETTIVPDLERRLCAAAQFEARVRSNPLFFLVSTTRRVRTVGVRGKFGMFLGHLRLLMASSLRTPRRYAGSLFRAAFARDRQSPASQGAERATFVNEDEGSTPSMPTANALSIEVDPLFRENPDERLLLESGLFDSNFYLDENPDVANAGVDPVQHYLEYGGFEGRKPIPMFDSSWYLAVHPDVAAAGANPLLHYVKHGGLEGRDPHPSFSGRWYLETYAEVAESGVNPLSHYLKIGRDKGFLPNDPQGGYKSHLLREHQIHALESIEVRRHVDIMVYQPIMVVLVDTSMGGDIQATLAALDRQIYPHWRHAEFRNGDADAEAPDFEDDIFVVWVRAGDIPHARLLYAFAAAINGDPGSDLVYADEDSLTEAGQRIQPFYKPDWSPDYLESFNFIGRPACFRGSMARKHLKASKNYYDFVLRFTEEAKNIVHVRQVLYSRLFRNEDMEPFDPSGDVSALEGRLLRTGRVGCVSAALAGNPCYDVKIDLAHRPLVSIIIPTAGKVVEIKHRQLDLIFNCLDSIERISTYPNLEFVIVDNGDLGWARTEKLRRRGCKLITFQDARFNIAKKLNLGASIATGEYLLLMNDDIEPLTPDWIERLLEHFEKPHVGVVGAKLLYPNHTTQHVGVVLNSGSPDHARRLQPRGDLGYFYSTLVVRNFTAVTGAVMMARADVYRDVGGYSEALAISYNDVDFCLKIREQGLSIVYAPWAELIHFESQSRVACLDLEEAEYFHTRWASMTATDPYYNEDNLTVAAPTFEVAHNPRRM